MRLSECSSCGVKGFTLVPLDTLRHSATAVLLPPLSCKGRHVSAVMRLLEPLACTWRVGEVTVVAKDVLEEQETAEPLLQ